MAKKKIKLKSIFKAKLTKVQIIFSLIFLIIIFAGLWLLLLSNSTLLQYRMLIYSQELQAKNNYYDYLQSLTPTPTIPIPTIIPPTPTSNPQATPIDQLPNQNFNKLIVYQASEGHENIATFTKVITDSTEIKEIYNDIKSLPLWPQSSIPMNCPIDTINSYVYVLNFYSNDVLTIHALLNLGGCVSVGITNYKPRIAINQQGGKLVNDLQQILNLSRQEFYGINEK